MNENDLRDCFAMFAMMSRTFGGSPNEIKFDAEMCYTVADAMLEARKKEDDEEGIVAIKKRVRKTK